jgi:hypothetical protein
VFDACFIDRRGGKLPIIVASRPYLIERLEVKECDRGKQQIQNGDGDKLFSERTRGEQLTTDESKSNPIDSTVIDASFI